jgi:hypothetical protein
MDAELVRLRSACLARAWEASTLACYRSGAMAYERFCAQFSLPVWPVCLSSLEFFIAWMASRFAWATITGYVTAVRHFALAKGQSDFDSVRQTWTVRSLLCGARKMAQTRTGGPMRALPIDATFLVAARTRISSAVYEEALVWAVFTVGIAGLFRLGELTQADPGKQIARNSLLFTNGVCTIFLPYSKTDRFYRGDTVVLQAWRGRLALAHPGPALVAYLRLRDAQFHDGPLFVRPDGSPPTRDWVVAALRRVVGSFVGGHSLRATGATWLAQSGASELDIMRAGRWSSDAYQRYLRDHPTVHVAFVAAGLGG